MNRFQLNLPAGARSSVYVHYGMKAQELNQDLITVELANGRSIEAGWFPENDPNGQYVVRVFQGRDELQEVFATSETELKFAVESLAREFSGRLARSPFAITISGEMVIA